MTRPVGCSSRVRWPFVSLVLLGLLGLFVPRGWADPNGPTVDDRIVTRAVTGLLKKEHLTKHPLDQEIADRMTKEYLKLLDPKKVFFYQSDIDSFLYQETGLDEQITKGDVGFGYRIFNTFIERVDERVKMVDELLTRDFDFTTDEELVIDSDAASYPRNEAEARELWRKQVKYELLSQKADKIAEEKKHAEKKDEKDRTQPTDSNSTKKQEDPHARIARRYHSIAKRMHQTDHHELLEMYLTSLTTAYDPHSTYMSPETLENFEIMMRLNLEGIGASLGPDDGYTVVKELVPGGAAEKDGRLKPQDRIVGVGQGESGEIVDVLDMKLSEVVEKIRGKRGTTVRLEVMPAGTEERKIYNIVRARIELKDSEARSEIIERDRDGRTYRIGVIDLPSFYMDMEAARRGIPDYKSTTRDVARILDEFREQKVDAVILDLHRNGGGSLTEAISVTGLFIDEGPIVQVKDKDNNVHHYDDLEQGAAWDGPLVVLTSRFSASASEIFAGAIQDYARGLIVGDKSTHGKGTVQSLLDLGERLIPGSNPPKLGALKITMQQFYRPDGDSTQSRGVLADVVLPSLINVLDKVGEADLDYALAFDRIDPVPYNRVNLVDKTVIDQLNKLSTERREKSDGFQKVARDISRYEERKNRKTVTLNEEKFLAERAELNADKEEEKQFEELNSNHRPVFDSESYYNREVLDVTIDYLRLARLARAN